MTDAQLLEQAQQGASGAWQSLYERLLPSVWRAVRARVSDRDAAEDIVSETFLALVRNLHTLSPNSCRLHGWLMQVARNKVGDWARRRACRARAMEELSETGTEKREVDPALAPLVDENRRLVMNVLDSLRHEHRVVLELKYSDELSVRDIAARIGQTEKSIESLLFRARVEFRRKYELSSRQAVLPASLSRERHA